MRAAVLALATSWLTLAWGTGLRVDPEWREVRYRGRTSYSLVADSSGVRLRAETRGQNSALLRPLPSDARVRRLRWTWRVLRHPENADPGIRARDDRAAAVLVLVRRSWLPWRTRALMYQWSPAGRPGEWVASPYARRILVRTLRTAPAGADWVAEERDLDRDLLEAFGEIPASIEAIGVISDADNTGDHAIAEFGALEIDEAQP